MKIRIGQKKDKKKIIDFIKKRYFRKNHILTKKNGIFDFFFLKKDKLNFVIAESNKKILGILGFIPNSHWSSKSDLNDLWIGWWQCEKRFNGLMLINFLLYKYKPKLLATYGVQNKTLRDKLFSNKELTQYLMINKDYQFRNSNLKHTKIGSSNKFELHSLKRLNKNIHKSLFSSNPYKDLKFFRNKYEKNKFYDYFFIHFKTDNKINLILICRLIQNEKKKIRFIKILDVIGMIKEIEYSNLLRKFLILNNVKYIDLQCLNLNEKNLIKFGFKKNKNEIYNFYEPYKKIHSPHVVSIIKNIYKKKLYFYAGDGDNERPRIL